MSVFNNIKVFYQSSSLEIDAKSTIVKSTFLLIPLILELGK